MTKTEVTVWLGGIKGKSKGVWLKNYMNGRGFKLVPWDKFVGWHPVRTHKGLPIYNLQGTLDSLNADKPVYIEEIVMADLQAYFALYKRGQDGFHTNPFQTHLRGISSNGGVLTSVWKLVGDNHE